MHEKEKAPRRASDGTTSAHHTSAASTTAPAYDRSQIARQLLDAERLCTPAAGVTPRYPSVGLDEAYEVQWTNIRARQDVGARIVGHKVGLTSVAMREQMGVSEPDSGVLLEDMAILDGGVLRTGDLLVPRVETEFGFRLGHDLAGGEIDLARARSAVSEIFLALEIIDSRFGAWDLTVIDSIADNASSARFVVGSPVSAPVRWDLRDTSVSLRIDGAERAQGVGGAVMGDPVRALVWLAHRLHRCGRRLHAGDLVLAGSVHASVALRPGQHIEAWSPPWPPVGFRTV